MRKLLLNPYIYCSVLLLLGAGIGFAVAGVADLLVAATMPWLDEPQRRVIFVCFLAMGPLLGLYCIWIEFRLGKFSRAKRTW